MEKKPECVSVQTDSRIPIISYYGNRQRKNQEDEREKQGIF